MLEWDAHVGSVCVCVCGLVLLYLWSLTALWGPHTFEWLFEGFRFGV